jgi:hypothetical protein
MSLLEEEDEILSDSNSKKFLKTLLLGLAILLVGGGIIYYFTGAKHGELAYEPPGLDTAVRMKIGESTTREISNLTFYNCSYTKINNVESRTSGYSVIVEMSPRAVDKENPSVVDPERYWQVFASGKEGQWQLQPFKGFDVKKQNPCER